MPTYSDPTVVELSASPKIQTGSIIALVAGVLALLGAGFFYYQTTAVERQAAEVAEANTTKDTGLKDLRASTAKELADASALAADLRLLFDSQTDWNATFSKIQSRLYNNMAVTSLSVDEKGQVSLTGKTRSYTDYARIYRSMTDSAGQTVFSSVRPTSMVRQDAGTPNDRIEFSFSLVLVPDPAKKATTGAAAAQPAS